MAAETKNKKADSSEVNEQQANRKLPKSRRYVGSKETFTYVLYDIAQSFNIGSKTTYYLNDVLVISYWWQAIVNFFVSIWDIVNDLFLAAIVDRTNTRFGKFKPYLIMYAIPGTIMSVIYWMLPAIFPDTSATFMPKIITFFVLQMVQNLVTSMYNIAKTGILSTITPDVMDRTRLINQANLFSSLVENIPKQLMTVFVDLVNHGTLKIKMTTLFVWMGSVTAIIAGALGLIFALKCKERVLQSVEKPSFKNSFGSIFKNKPLLLLTLSEFLAQFHVDAGIDLYYINVLNFGSASLIVGIPGMPVTYLSYTYVNKLRERFSTKALWVFSDSLGPVLTIMAFLLGSINKNYKKVVPMMIILAAKEAIWNTIYATRKVIPEEVRNEIIDYGEWTCGYRTEGMTGVAKGLVSKIVATFKNSFQAALLGIIGYKQGLKPGQQTERTEYLLFVCVTLVPALTGMISNIPKMFYNIDAKTKERMYSELKVRRAETERLLREKEAMESIGQSVNSEG
ncbi:MAG: MFS transporter [Clostridia bacterium]|nr:MFS transporter [Clostridia bacterium]